nr:uncharacterized protein LOC100184975 isoform X1 [Ciona intestinalis]|eukprot:XP_026690100.1 uncharacterized protein LOC100184975 isoform X1 [Ciona intestinalis]
MVIRIYWASVTGNRKVDGEQTRLRNIIESLKLESQWVDITTDPLIKQKMRDECGNQRAMPPQIFNDEKYLGSVEDMEIFIEEKRSQDFFNGNSVTLTDGPTMAHDVTNDVTAEVFTHNRNNSNGASPTSSIENEPIVAYKAREQESEVKSYLPPPRKNVLAAVGAFESLKDAPPKTETTKVIFTKSKQSTEHPIATDEERKRRILGLSSRDNSEIPSSKPASFNGERSVNKIPVAT